MSAKASFGGANASKKCYNSQSSNSDPPVLNASDTATATHSFNVGPTAQHPTSLNQFLGVAASSELYTYCLTIPYIELTSDSLCTALLASQCEAGIHSLDSAFLCIWCITPDDQWSYHMKFTEIYTGSSYWCEEVPTFKHCRLQSVVPLMSHFITALKYFWRICCW